MARQERPLRDFAVLLYGAGLGFLTNLATNSADGWAPPFTVLRDHSEFLLGAGVVVPAAYYMWRQRKLRTEHEWDAGKQGNPYPGLQAFGPEHESVFFGRDRAKQELYERLDVPGGAPEARFLLVAGASGSGKSSLVNAGLASLMRRRKWWQSTPVVPGRDPFGALVHALHGELPKADGDALVRQLRTEGERALERLRRTDDPRSTHPEVLTTLFRAALSTNRPAVLLLDQAEELVTQVDAQTRQEFMAVLHTALADHRRLHVVATMRAEFIADFLPEPSGALLTDPYFVTRLNRAELRQIITDPARKAGVEIESEAAAAMVDDATEAGADVLPLLAHLLHNLYEDHGSDGRITLPEYLESGRVEKAISSTADKVLASLVRQYNEEKVMRTLLRFVSWASHAEDPTRNRVRLTDLDGGEQRIAQEFLEARLLTDEDPGARDLAHEALLRQWEPLRKRLADQRPLLRQRTFLEQRAQEWDQSAREADLLLSESQVDEAAAVAKEIACSEQLQEFVEASAELRRRARRERAIGAARRIEEIKESNPALALAVAREAAELSPGQSTAVALWARLRDPLARAVRRHSKTVLDTCWDADGLLWAIDSGGTVMAHDLDRDHPVVTRRLPVGSMPRTAAWSTASTLAFADRSGFSVWNLGVDEIDYVEWSIQNVRLLAWSEQGLLAGGGSTGELWVRRPGETEPVVVARHRGELRSLAWHGELLASCADDGTVRCWNSDTDETVVLYTHVAGANSVAWSRDGWLASCGGDGTVRVWNRATGVEDVPRSWRHVMELVTWTDDGQLVMGSRSASRRAIHVWRRDDDWARALDCPVEQLAAVRPAPGGELLVCQVGGAMKLLRADSGPSFELRSEDPVTAGAVHGTTLFTGGLDGRVRRLNGSSLKPVGGGGHVGSAELAVWSADGRLAIVTDANSSRYGEVVVWDRRSGTLSAALRHDGLVHAVAWSAQGFLASCGGDATVRVWDGGSDRSRVAMGFSGPVAALSWSDSGMLAAGNHEMIQIWDSATGESRAVQQQQLDLGGRRVQAIAWSSDGLLAAGGDSGVVQVWSQELEQINSFHAHVGNIRFVAWSAGGLLAIGGDHAVRLWRPDDEFGIVDQQQSELCALAWSSNGLLATGWANGSVRVWSPGGTSSERYRHTDKVAGLSWSPDGRLLSYAGPMGDSLVIWDSSTGSEYRHENSRHVRCAAWSADGELTTVELDRRIRLWSSDLKEFKPIGQHGGLVSRVVVSKTGLVASHGLDRSILLWNQKTGSVEKVLSDVLVNALAWSPDGLLYIGQYGGAIQSLDGATGAVTKRIGDVPAVRTMAWNERGALAFGGHDFVVCVWDSDSGQVSELRRHAAAVTSLVWLDDRRLVSGGRDGLFVWDVPEGEVLTVGDEVDVDQLAWAPGRPVVSADEQGRIRFWDVDSGQVIATVPAHESHQLSVLCWRDDGLLVTAGKDRRVLTWDVGTDAEALLREADERGIRRLTDQERARFGLA